MKRPRRHRYERGAAAVEFALVLPVLLLILFGIIEYGWVFTAQIVLTNAVSEGARAGIQAEDDVEALEFAKEAVREAYWVQALEDGVVEVDIREDTPRRLVVDVAGMPYTPLTGFLPSALVPQTLGAKAVMAFP
jgi:Flp pilus assembly protein TadG